VVVLKYDYPTLYVHATQYTCTPNNVIKVKEKNLLKRTNVLKHEGRLISFDSGWWMNRILGNLLFNLTLITFDAQCVQGFM